MIWGQVVPSVLAPNVAREVSLLPQLLPSVPAYSLNRACASGAQAITNAADQIELGHADVILAGGVESLSDIPILHSRRFSQILVEAGKARPGGAGWRRSGPDPPARPGAGDPGRSPSRPPARPWASRPRRWPRRTASRREAQDRLALHEPPARRRRRRPTGGSTAGDRALVRRPGDGRDRHDRQRHPVRHVARGARPSSGRCSTAATARSPRATPRRSPTAPPRCCSWRRTRRAALGYEPLGLPPELRRRRGGPGWQLLMGPVYAVPRALERAGIALAGPRPGRDPRGVRRPGAVATSRRGARRPGPSGSGSRGRSARWTGSAPT